MGFIKKVLLLTTTIIAVTMSACSSKTPVNTTTAPGVESTPVGTTEVPREVAYKYQMIPETLDNPDNLPVLDWVCFPNVGTAFRFRETSADSINQALADQNMPFRVRFHIVTTDQTEDILRLYQQEKVQDLMSSADLLYLFVSGETEFRYLLPVTEYTTEGGSLADTVPTQRHWLKSTFQNEIYGIPGSADFVIGNGWSIADEVIDDFAFHAEDFRGKLYWEMDDVFQRIYVQNGNKPFLYKESGGVSYNNATKAIYPVSEAPILMNRFQILTSVYGIDYYGGEKPKVVNYLDTDYARNLQAAQKRYGSAGYGTGDLGKSLVRYGNVFSGFVFQYRNSNLFYSVPVEPLDFTYGGSGGYMSGVSATSDRKEAAVSMLSLLGDPAFRQILYTNGNISQDESSETGSSGMSIKLFFLTPFRELESDSASNIYYPAAEGKTALETFREQVEKAELRLPSNLFDVTSLLIKAEMVNDAAKPYLSKFSELTPDEYDQMLQDMKVAGGDEILAELQRQLDEWLAENPNWQY